MGPSELLRRPGLALLGHRPPRATMAEPVAPSIDRDLPTHPRRLTKPLPSLPLALHDRLPLLERSLQIRPLSHKRLRPSTDAGLERAHAGFGLASATIREWGGAKEQKKTRRCR